MPKRTGFAHRITQLRALADISARQVDALAGLKGTCYTNSIELGARVNILNETLAAIADVFGVSMDWLFRGVGPEPTQVEVVAAVARARAAAQTPVADAARGLKRTRRRRERRSQSKVKVA